MELHQWIWRIEVSEADDRVDINERSEEMILEYIFKRLTQSSNRIRKSGSSEVCKDEIAKEL